jgi:hypothetical protein
MVCKVCSLGPAASAYLGNSVDTIHFKCQLNPPEAESLRVEVINFPFFKFPFSIFVDYWQIVNVFTG